MGFISRVFNAINAGITSFRDEALIPIEELGWDTYAARLYRYQLGERYYSNVAYKSLSLIGAMAANRKIDNKLYKRIRGIYNPIFRLVEAYVAKVYGGAIDFDGLEKGAMPFQEADDDLRQAIKRALLWSNFRINKDLYVRQTSKLGDGFLKVVDDQLNERVRLEILHPSKVNDMVVDATGKVKRIMIEYPRVDESSHVFRPNKVDGFVDNLTYYTYTEIITEDSVETFRDGQPFAYVNDSDGTKLAKWDNPYGFVPVVPVQFRNEGLNFGASAYNSSLDKIDELNGQASLLDDSIKKSIDILWLLKGMAKTELASSDDASDAIKAIFSTKLDVDAQALVPNINIADTITNIEHLQAEVEKDLPELGMNKLHSVSNPTAPALKAQFNDGVDRFVAGQSVLDGGLVDGLQMLLSIAGFRGYKDFKRYNLVDYANQNFEFYLAPRPIFEDQLDITQRITFLMGSGAPNRAVWAELGVSPDDVDEWQAEADANKSAMADLLNPQIGGDQGNTPDMMGKGSDQPSQLPGGMNNQQLPAGGSNGTKSA